MLRRCDTFFGPLNSLGLGAVGGYVWRSYEHQDPSQPHRLLTRLLRRDPGVIADAMAWDRW